MIKEIKPAYWDKDKQEWVIECKMWDSKIGNYTQKINCETLICAKNYIKLLNEQRGK